MERNVEKEVKQWKENLEVEASGMKTANKPPVIPMASVPLYTCYNGSVPYGCVAVF